MRLTFLILCLASAAGFLRGQAPPSRSPIASNPVVHIEGKIRKVQIAPGQGMPFLEVQSGDQTTKVYLGSMRYLMQQDFNPKAGTRVSVKGYKITSDIIAISVTLPSEKKTLKLRDENGYPLWRGGMGMHGMGRPW